MKVSLDRKGISVFGMWLGPMCFQMLCTPIPTSLIRKFVGRFEVLHGYTNSLLLRLCYTYE